MGIWEATLVSMTVAKTNLSKIAARVNRTGESVTVLRSSRPWVEIRPLAYRTTEESAESATEERD